MIDLLGINSDSRTAGPGGERFEIFTKGCVRGMTNPCAGCFNESSWTFSGESRQTTAEELFAAVKEQAPHKRFTICGGEPMLQVKGLLPLLRLLKEDGFHIVMYTAYDAEILLRKGLSHTTDVHTDITMRTKLTAYAEETRFKVSGASVHSLATPEMIKELFSLVDLLIDGDYQASFRLTEARFMEQDWYVGSANQRLIDTKQTLRTGQLVYMQADFAKTLSGKEQLS